MFNGSREILLSSLFRTIIPEQGLGCLISDWQPICISVSLSVTANLTTHQVHHRSGKIGFRSDPKAVPIVDSVIEPGMGQTNLGDAIK